MKRTIMTRSLQINSAARNAVWIYDAIAQSRFPGAPAMVEKSRSHEQPDFHSLPESADIAVKLYAGAITLRLDGSSHRIYIRRFEFVSCTSEEEARYRFMRDLLSLYARTYSRPFTPRNSGPTI